MMGTRSGSHIVLVRDFRATACPATPFTCDRFSMIGPRRLCQEVPTGNPVPVPQWASRGSRRDASDRLWLESALPLCTEAGGTRPGDGLSPVGHLQAGKDVGHMVAGGLQADAHAVGHRLIGESLGE